MASGMPTTVGDSITLKQGSRDLYFGENELTDKCTAMATVKTVLENKLARISSQIDAQCGDTGGTG